jgi:cysteine desulfurase/selenocysteine lyase
MTDYENVQYLPPPERFEGGLLNYSGIIGTGAAVDYLQRVGMDDISAHEVRLNVIATAGLSDLPSIKFLEPLDPRRRGGLLPFNIKGMTSHDVAMIIDEMAKVQIRSGMHCMHPFFLSRKIDGCARASFYLYNTEEECKLFVDAVKLVASTFSS